MVFLCQVGEYFAYLNASLAVPESLRTPSGKGRRANQQLLKSWTHNLWLIFLRFWSHIPPPNFPGAADSSLSSTVPTLALTLRKAMSDTFYSMMTWQMDLRTQFLKKLKKKKSLILCNCIFASTWATIDRKIMSLLSSGFTTPL